MIEFSEEELENMSPEELAEVQKKNCLFCKIISGELPSKKVYEDDEFIAILDINPGTPGHCVLLPKKHFQILPQIPSEILEKMANACKEISNKLIKGFDCEGTSIFVANGYVAGQKAPHVMIHIFPRSEKDSINLNPELVELSENDFNNTKKIITVALGITTPQNKSKITVLKDQKIVNKKEKNIETKKSEKNDDYSDEEPKNISNHNKSKNDDKNNKEVDLDKIAKLFT